MRYDGYVSCSLHAGGRVATVVLTIITVAAMLGALWSVCCLTGGACLAVRGVL